MKKHLFMLLASAATISFTACNNAGKGSETSTDSTGAIQQSNTPGNTQGTDTSGTRNDAAATGTTDAATTGNGSNTNLKLDSNAVTFIHKAASGGMMEVQLGQVAGELAASERVKNFGAMMMRDHNNANSELKQLASTKNVTLPAALEKEHQHHVEMLNKKKGVAFDKAYMKMMVEDHQKDIQEFEKASTQTQDPQVKEFATRTLPILRMHLDSAKAINKSL